MAGAEAIRILVVPADPAAPERWLDGPGAVPQPGSLPPGAVLGLAIAGDPAAADRLRRLAMGPSGPLATAGVAELLATRPDLALEPASVDGALWRLHPASAARGLARSREPQAVCDIGVLPFRAPPDEPLQQARAWGLSDDVAVGLTRFRELSVMGRGTLWALRDSALPGAEIGRRLGLRTVLEGSLRDDEGRLRLDVSLVEVATGRAVWAERWLREPRGLHGLAEDLVERIVAAGVRMLGRLEGAPPVAPAADARAHDLARRGRATLEAGAAGVEAARALAEAALDLDPGCGAALLLRARCLMLEGDAAAALDDAAAAAAADPQDARAQAMVGDLRLAAGDFDAAEAAWEAALALNPGDAAVKAGAAQAFVTLGRAEEALDLILRAMVLDPWYPDGWLAVLGTVHLARRQPGEAVRAFLRMQRPEDAGSPLAAALAWAGRAEEAGAAAARLRDAGQSVAALAESWSARNPADTDYLVEGLRQAGLD